MIPQEKSAAVDRGRIARFGTIALLAIVLGCAACHASYSAHPLALDAVSLDGGALDAQALRGKPWVIALWMPG